MTTTSAQPEPQSENGWAEPAGPFDGFQGMVAETGVPARSSMLGLTAIRQVEIPQAIQRLDDIVRETEGSANQILDACAALDALADATGGDLGDSIGRATTAIYEACAFQDLSGQRITGVTKTLGLIEGKLSELASQFGILADDPSAAIEPLQSSGDGAFDSVQLSGPQHPGSAADQAAIDHLFAETE